jgi:hypothetical protein
MSRRSTTVFAVAAVIAVGGAGAWYVLGRPLELPDPQEQPIRDVFPDSDLRAAKPGSEVRRVYASFGRKPSDGSSDAGERCVAFRYDPELHDGALVVLARDGVIRERWLVARMSIPPECAGLHVEEVDLSGWYAASVQ